MPKINYSSVRKILLSAFIVIFVFVAGYAAGYTGFTSNSKNFPKVTISREAPVNKSIDFSLFWKVWDMMESKYFDKDKLIPSQMLYGAIKGMVASVGDPYTIFLSPEENRVVQEDLQGNFEGVGIQIGYKGNQLAVIAPLPESPADKSGIRAGDLIAAIKDTSKNIDRTTIGISLPEAVQAIRGPAGSKVTLTLLREGTEEPLVMEISRESINVPSVSLKLIKDENLEDGDSGTIAHIRVSKFGGETEGEWNKIVPEVLSQNNLKGIIVDVRNNPGGYLQGAVDLAGDFMETGEVVVIEEDGKKDRFEYKTEKLGRLKNEKVVVLVNEGSASASEIFAGALNDYDLADIVGSKTFGKGTIQEPQTIEYQAGLHITIAKWLTPKGTWVNGEGLTPDIEIEDNPDTEVDEQLNRAIELFR